MKGYDAKAPDPFNDDKGDAGGSAIVLLAGTTGAGKTFTALLMARGMAAQALGLDWNNPEHLKQIDEAIAVIDTETRRALHYKARSGPPTPHSAKKAALFGFRHAELDAPFSPEAYYRLIDAADRRAYKVIVIDSWSHEWEGEGGMVDQHDEDLDKALVKAEERARKQNNGSLPPWWRDDEQRDKLSIGAWARTKRLNKQLVGRMTRSSAHIIICLRAADKLRVETERETKTKRNGEEYQVTRTKITQPKDLPIGERWSPICEKSLPYEATVGFVLTPQEPGRPYLMKTLQQQLRGIFDLEKPLDEATGARLAAWARTGDAKTASFGAFSAQSPSVAPEPSPQRHLDGESPGSPSSSSPPIDDDGFPGDREPPQGRDMFSDFEAPAPHPEERKYNGALYRPDTPKLIAPAVAVMTAESNDLKAWAATLRNMIQHAPDDDARRAWKAENSADLLRLTNRSQALHGWALEHMPKDAPAGDATNPLLTGTGEL